MGNSVNTIKKENKGDSCTVESKRIVTRELIRFDTRKGEDRAKLNTIRQKMVMITHKDAVAEALEKLNLSKHDDIDLLLRDPNVKDSIYAVMTDNNEDIVTVKHYQDEQI